VKKNCRDFELNLPWIKILREPVEGKYKNRKRLPPWMKMQMPGGINYSRVKNIVKGHNLNTICMSGNCPNIGECWGRGTATFMILGNICTRNCRFCGVETGKPNPVDWSEPVRIARSVQIMGLKHCVITSVDRDDLEDGGSELWAMTIREIKRINPQTTMEVLIPDFRGNEKDINRIINEKPDVISHNIETVERLTKVIRSSADYNRSLKVVKTVSDSGITSKSGLMLGLGESLSEVLTTMDDLLEVNCRVMTIGQYLQPSADNWPVSKYYEPEIFERLKTIGIHKGFRVVESSPLVRSSYSAEKHVGA
jgi:lipoic acid synthetase